MDTLQPTAMRFSRCGTRFWTSHSLLDRIATHLFARAHRYVDDREFASMVQLAVSFRREWRDQQTRSARKPQGVRVHMDQHGRPLCHNTRIRDPRMALRWVQVTCGQCRRRSDRNGLP